MPKYRNSGACMYSGMRVLSKSQMQAMMFCVKRVVAIANQHRQAVVLRVRSSHPSRAPRLSQCAKHRWFPCNFLECRPPASLLRCMPSLPDIRSFQRRLDELDAQMADPSFYSNPRRAAEISREQQKLAGLIADHQMLQRVDREIAEARALLRDPSADPDLRELAELELPDNEKRREELEAAVLQAMIPPEPTDSRDTVLEIRAGTGGDEAALFAGELFRAYSRYADAHGWSVDRKSTRLNSSHV